MSFENVSGDLLTRTVACMPENEAALRGMDINENVGPVENTGIIEVL